jgi:hypothetical protein
MSPPPLLGAPCVLQSLHVLPATLSFKELDGCLHHQVDAHLDRLLSAYKHAQYLISAQAEKTISKGLFNDFFSKQILFLTFHITQHIAATPNVYILSPLGSAF